MWAGLSKVVGRMSKDFGRISKDVVRIEQRKCW